MLHVVLVADTNVYKELMENHKVASQVTLLCADNNGQITDELALLLASGIDGLVLTADCPFYQQLAALANAQAIPVVALVTSEAAGEQLLAEQADTFDYIVYRATDLLCLTETLRHIRRSWTYARAQRQATDELVVCAERYRQESAGNYDALQQTMRRIEELAYYDPITGLPNRVSIHQKIDEFLQRGGSGLLFLIDMDNFKIINNTFGHSYGDSCLQQIAARLERVKCAEGVVGRLGGDEFVLLSSGEAVERHSLAQQLLNCFREPLIMEDNSFHLTASIGVVQYPRDGQTADELLKNADAAMYKSKGSGRNTCTVFDKSINAALLGKLKMENYLRNAISNNEFELHYQPQLEVRSGRIRCMEALLRWHSPQLGYVPPLQFIRLAEEMGLIIPIGYWVLKEACRFAGELGKSYPDIYISVNLSSVQLMQADFVAQVKDLVAQAGISPHNIRLEITESILMESFDTAIEKLEQLKEFGLSIELDDFGTGYSSLNYLKQLPIHAVKIDKSFIEDIAEENGQINFTSFIVDIAHQLGLKVVAEGVENEQQMDKLREYQCDLLQGYFISRPLPAETLKRFLADYLQRA